MIFVLIIGLSYFWFLLHLKTRTRALVFAAAVIYLAGTIGIEMVAGPYAELYGQRNLTFALLAAMEEALEMAGIVVFIYALLDFMRSEIQEVRILLY